MLTIVFVLASFNLVLGQSNDHFANISSFGSSVRFDVGAPHAAVTLTVIGPEGVTFSKEFKSGNSPEFKLTSSKGERLPDGQYTYELRITPNFSSETKEALKAARETGNGDEVQRELRKNGAMPSQPHGAIGQLHDLRRLGDPAGRDRRVGRARWPNHQSLRQSNARHLQVARIIKVSTTSPALHGLRSGDT